MDSKKVIKKPNLIVTAVRATFASHARRARLPSAGACAPAAADYVTHCKVFFTKLVSCFFY